MDVFTLRVLARHWYATLPMIALAVVAGAAVALRSAPIYEAEGSVILLNSTTQAPADAGPAAEVVNPYLTVTGALNVTSGVVTRVLNSATTRQRLSHEGVPRGYEIQLVDDKLPVIAVNVTAGDPASAIRGVTDVQAAIAVELARMQLAVGAVEDQIVSTPLIEPTSAEESRTHIMRALVVIAALGVAAAVGLALLLEHARTRDDRIRGAVGWAAQKAEDDRHVLVQ